MLTVCEESLIDVLEELKPLLALHYDEISVHRQHGFPLDPDYATYLDRAQRGEVLCVTLREKGTVAGYFVGFVCRSLHYRTCLALTMDIFFVAPEHRGHKAGRMIFDEVRRCAKSRGVDLWMVGNKEHASTHITPLFESMGFEKIETYYGLWMGD